MSQGSVYDPSTLLEREIAGYRDLLQLLEAEQQALRVADADVLARLVQSKLRQVNHLQDFAAERVSALVSTGCEETAAGIRRWLAGGATPSAASDQWSLLVALAAGAQRQNDLNQRLALVQQRHVDRALAALWQAAGRASVYGADGRSQHNATSRALAAI